MLKIWLFCLQSIYVRVACLVFQQHHLISIPFLWKPSVPIQNSGRQSQWAPDAPGGRGNHSSGPIPKVPAWKNGAGTKIAILEWLSRPFLVTPWPLFTSSPGHPWAPFTGSCCVSKLFQASFPKWRLHLCEMVSAENVCLPLPWNNPTTSMKSPRPPGFKDFLHL